jgi:hypothetical protein
VFERGNKRGLNYGTTDGAYSVASKAILAALKACAAATTVADRTAQVEIIKRQIKVIYAQATLRYAKLVGDAIADTSAYEEYQADGMAFFNVIYPWVKASSVSTADIEAIVNFFDVETAPDSFNDFAYCKTKKAMETFLRCRCLAHGHARKRRRGRHDLCRHAPQRRLRRRDGRGDVLPPPAARTSADRSRFRSPS